MSAVTAAMVKELRDRTSAGMMDCKRALEQTAGDVDAAQKLLREKGMATAGKRAGRETTEGKVGFRVEGGVGTLVAVGCETEPVSNNEEFLAYAKHVLEAAHADGPEAVQELEDERVELVGKIGENIAVRGAVRYEAGEGETIAGYAHPPANKIGVLVKVRGDASDAARRLAMHISFSAPRYTTRADVPEEDVAAERDIYLKRPEVQSKPEAAREKIVEGMLGKRFFGEVVLVDQQWIHETSKSVGRALADEGLEVVAFERFALSE